jgi:hypothetical protein
MADFVHDRLVSAMDAKATDERHLLLNAGERAGADALSTDREALAERCKPWPC